MADESGGEPRREGGCGVGARLRDARERAGLSIAQAAQRLRVATETLEALEAERFDALGASIYVKGYLGRYAELLGESPEALRAQLAAAVLPEPDLTDLPHATAQSNRSTVVAVIAVGVFVLAALAWWGWSRRRAVQAVAVEVRQAAVQPRAYAVPRSVVPRASVAPKPSLGAVLSPAVAPKSSPAIPAQVRGAVRITLKFPAVSWVAVSDATGRHLYRDTVSAGATKSFTGRPPLHVVVGYADGVTLTVDGRPAPINSYVGRDHAVSIAVAADGRISPVPWHAGE